MELSDTEPSLPSPLPKSSPLKEANSGTRRLAIEDDTYVQTITGPISEYGRHLDWAGDLQCNRLDWGEVSTPSRTPKRTPTANSFGRMLQQKQSTGRGTPSQSAGRHRPSPACGERLFGDDDEKSIYYYDEILGHKRTRNKEYLFKVKWNTGEITFEPKQFLR